jgi:hypothetical protein
LTDQAEHFPTRKIFNDRSDGGCLPYASIRIVRAHPGAPEFTFFKVAFEKIIHINVLDLQTHMPTIECPTVDPCKTVVGIRVHTAKELPLEGRPVHAQNIQGSISMSGFQFPSAIYG